MNLFRREKKFCRTMGMRVLRERICCFVCQIRSVNSLINGKENLIPHLPRCLDKYVSRFKSCFQFCIQWKGRLVSYYIKNILCISLPFVGSAQKCENAGVDCDRKRFGWVFFGDFMLLACNWSLKGRFEEFWDVKSCEFLKKVSKLTRIDLKRLLISKP